jgi:sugar phosphate isomerase/epimerase
LNEPASAPLSLDGASPPIQLLFVIPNHISRRAINHADTSDDALLNRFLVNRNSRDIIRCAAMPVAGWSCFVDLVLEKIALAKQNSCSEGRANGENRCLDAVKHPIGTEAMRTIKGPAIFLAQFVGDEPPFNNLDAIAGWAAGHGYKGVQIPSWDRRLFDLERAAASTAYCDEVRGVLAKHGIEATELSTHLQGQLVAVHTAYDLLFDGFAPEAVRNNPPSRQAWAVEQLLLAAKASARLGLKAHATFSGALAWPYIYPWPQRPPGLIETAFNELAARWRPILDAFDDAGVDLCFEIHPGEDLHDGATFEMFLERVGNHRRCNMLYDPSHFVLQQLDYLDFIDLYHDRIKIFHVKDAEFNPSGRQGVYGGYQPWIGRAGRFRSTGDGEVDFTAIFSKLTQYDYPGWAVLEWECCIKSSEQGAAEGAPFIARHIIEAASRSFDDFAGTRTADETNRRLLGLR